jgi:hypothetical protein
MYEPQILTVDLRVIANIVKDTVLCNVDAYNLSSYFVLCHEWSAAVWHAEICMDS